MIRFSPLFTLEVTHAFYAGRCRDFAFVIPEGTQQALRNGRLLAKEREGMLHVLYEADGDGVALVPTPGAVLRFGLRLLNPFFDNFTIVPEGFPVRRLFYRNTADAEALDEVETIPLVGPVFAHELSDAARPVTVTVADAGGGAVAAETVAEDDERSSVSFDLRGLPPGMLVLTESYPDDETSETSYYLDAELGGLDCVGIVEVGIDEGFYDTPPDFEIAFEAREETISYYLVARNYTNGDLAQLSVSDVGFSEDGRDEIVFEQVAAELTLAEVSPSAGSDTQVVLFRSEDPQPRREKARRRIQLSKNNDVLIANLPQPGADRAKAELIIHLSKP